MLKFKLTVLLGLAIAAYAAMQYNSNIVPDAPYMGVLADNYDYTIAAGMQEEQLPKETNPESLAPEEDLRVILSPIHRTTLSCQVGITSIQKIAKKMGQSFEKGELLIKLDDTIFLGLLKKAQGSWEKAKSEFEAKSQLYHDNIASIFEIKLAQADMATAESDVISAQYSVDACTIKAPYDGRVVHVFVEEHELIEQGKPLIEIVDESSLIGKLLVPSTMLNSISLGQKVSIKIVETNSTVEGKILRIDSVIDPASSMIKVDIEIKNTDRSLLAGMIGLINLK